MEITVYLLTSDLTYNILPLSLYMWKKYAQQLSLVVLGFNKGKQECQEYNVQFISLGISQNIDIFTSYLHDFFKTVSDKYIIISLDDMFPVSFVEMAKLSTLIKTKPSLLKCNLTSSEYQKSHLLNLQVSLWNRMFFIDSSKTGNSPWKFETSGDNINNNPNKFPIISNIKHSYVFSHNKLICDFSPNYIIQVNSESAMSKEYNYVNLMGISFNDVEYVLNKIKNKTNMRYGFGHSFRTHIVLNSKISNIEYIITKFNEFINIVKKLEYYRYREYYYLFKNKYTFI